MIPVNTPFFNGNELKYITECVKTGWVSSEGKFISLFEQQFSSYIGQEYGIAVSNGSAALDIAIKALNINNGDEVIMPTFTIISPAQSVIRNGGLPVLVDSNIDTWNMDINQIEKKITKKTKAILVVHTYGLPVDMEPVLLLCKKYNLFLIEDAAEVHGQTYNGKMCGSFGDISIFSFYPNKIITTGEGGMILCNNKDLSERCKKLRNLSFDPNGRRFIHDELGWNYRMTNMQAAIGVAQLENINNHILRKKQIGLLYNNLFKNNNNFKLPLEKTKYSENIYWVYGIIVKNENDLLSYTTHLNSQSIGTRPFFWCMHEQPVFKKMGLFINEKYPVAEHLSRHGFYLPSGLGISNTEIEEVANQVNLLF
jgi:perosamine synthetase